MPVLGKCALFDQGKCTIFREKVSKITGEMCHFLGKCATFDWGNSA